MSISRIKELRKNHKYSQKYVANLLGISQAQYFKIENHLNNITYDKLSKLASLYDTSIDYLLYRTDTTYPYPKREKNLQE